VERQAKGLGRQPLNSITVENESRKNVHTLGSNFETVFRLPLGDQHSGVKTCRPKRSRRRNDNPIAVLQSSYLISPVGNNAYYFNFWLRPWARGSRRRAVVGCFEKHEGPPFGTTRPKSSSLLVSLETLGSLLSMVPALFRDHRALVSTLENSHERCEQLHKT